MVKNGSKDGYKNGEIIIIDKNRFSFPRSKGIMKTLTIKLSSEWQGNQDSTEKPRTAEFVGNQSREVKWKVIFNE